MGRLIAALLLAATLSSCTAEPIVDTVRPTSVTTPADVGEGVEVGGRIGQTGERG